mmetsp:Transcript_379/g.1371  ORF Transcript_379/g.1371 Transcript_379/m.1371 type:complete len:221 (+) Transcript_379:711-1373(+)
MTLLTPRTSTPSFSSWSSMRATISSRAFFRSSSSETSPYRSTNSALTRSRIFDGPPPAESWRSMKLRPSVMPELATLSSFSGGVNPKFTKSRGIASKFSVFTWAMNSKREYRKFDGTSRVMPKSRMHSLPSSVLRRLPGCGSQWRTPESKSIVRYAFMATPQSRGTSGDADTSRRVPSIHSVTRTFPFVSSETTLGAITASSPRFFMASEKSRVFLASAR